VVPPNTKCNNYDLLSAKVTLKHTVAYNIYTSAQITA